MHGFSEIGAKTKLIVIQKEPGSHLDIDTEFSLRIVQLEIGIKAHFGPKPSPLLRISIKPELKFPREDVGQKIYDSIEDLESNIYWKAEIEVYCFEINKSLPEYFLDMSRCNKFILL